MSFESDLLALGHGNYTSYLRSPHWNAFKWRYRRSGLPRECAVCGKGRVELHHHTYARLGSEELTDVTPLCGYHHERVHKWLRVNSREGVTDTGEAVVALRNALQALPVVNPEIVLENGGSVNRGDICTFLADVRGRGCGSLARCLLNGVVK